MRRERGKGSTQGRGEEEARGREGGGEGGGEREGGEEREDKKGEGNITGATLATSHRTPNRTAASNDQCQACVASTRSHTCILVMCTHTENVYSSNCSQKTFRSGWWE